MSQELVKANDFAAISSLGKVFAESGMFTDVKSAAQAIVKIHAGAEIGLPAFTSVSGIHIIAGKPVIGAGLIASLVKKSGKYNYRVTEHTEKVCSIDFYEGGEKVGNSTFTIEDAKKAQTKNLDKFPRNMLFARAISNGVKWYAADVFAGPVYVPEEMPTIEQATQDIPHEEVWEPTEAQWNEANSLLSGSTLEDSKKVIATNSLSNAKNQKAWDKIITRLQETQTVAP